MFQLNLIAAIDKNNGIGYQGGIPWNLSDDLKRFRDLTINHVIIMGRKTAESIPSKFFPLKDRINCIISTNPDYGIQYNLQHNVRCYTSIHDCMEDIIANIKPEKVFVIGGESIYTGFVENYRIHNIYITKVYGDYVADKFFPKIETNQDYVMTQCSKIEKEKDIYYRYVRYEPIPWSHSEYPHEHIERHQYQRLLSKILEKGEVRETRNSRTISLFGESMRFDIEKQGFPLLTTKRVFFKGVAEELLWFIKGDTDAKHLMEKGVKIWNGNSDREYLDSHGFEHYEEYCCGPIYGYQWRHFNAPYDPITKTHVDYSKGIDQLKEVIDLIKTDPTSRRIIMSGWNPCQLPEMVLPPCHVSYQFYVSHGTHLSCHMYQRSGDVFLGVPFNIASTALLTSLIAATCDLEVGEIMISFGDVHIYENHIEQVKTQISRVERGFPILNITKRDNIEDYVMEDIKVIGYDPHPTIKADMVA